MNKTLFFSGLAIFGFEVLGIIIYLLSTLDWSFVSVNVIMDIIAIMVIVIINILAFIFMIMGALEK